MADVFLSYASEDRSRIVPLVQALTAEGWSVWWDREIIPGVDWKEVIEREVDGARCVVVVWSRISVAKAWVRNEANEGLRRNVLVPVSIDAVQMPLECRHLQAADLVDWKGDRSHPQYRHVHAAVSRTLHPNRAIEAADPSSSFSARRWARPVLVSLALLLVLVAGLGAARLRAVRSILGGRSSVVIGIMDITPQGKVEQWLCDFTRDKLNATLNKFGRINVVPKEMIDFLQERKQLSDVEAAEELEIDQMISGTIVAKGPKLILQVRVSNLGSRKLVATAEAGGTEDELESMQNRVAFEIVKALQVDIASSELEQLLALRPTARPDDYRLVAESMGLYDDDGGDLDAKPGASPHSWLLDWPATATAAESPEDAAIRELLEAYRAALESESVLRIGELYVEVNDKMRASLERYFENAEGLSVAFSDLSVLVEGDQALATFTRSDEFKDAASGRPVRVELRVSSLLEKRDAGWKIRGLKKPT